ncbi:MAG TPA: ABC transporter permease [Candidatus Angelobacter sp.]|nr:ABC transporter permease [Candidatus Angelobacter sp.]
MLETTASDIRYALRQFGRNRGFALTVILTASLGIGLNTAMFSVIRGVLLEPLGYHDPDRLVVFANGATPVRFEETLSSARSYDGLGAYMNGMESLACSGEGEPEVLSGARVSANFLDILAVPPLRGRSFLPDEDKPGAPPVAMISEELWQRRFAGTPSIAGRSITLAGTGYAIVGVLPAKFQFPFPAADVWLPRPSEALAMDPRSRPLSPILRMFGRLKPGVDLAQADAELLVIDRQYDLAHPGMLDSNMAVARRMNRPPEHVERLKDRLVSDVRLKLWLLFGAVGLVLMIVCANIASLLLARATARSHEFAVRAAIGASRRAIIAQLLSESALLSITGGMLGVALAELSVKTLRGMTLLDLPRSAEIRIDGPVLLFAVVLSLLAGLVFGLAPALSASRPDLAGVLRGRGLTASVSGPLRFPPRSLLVVAQVALSTVLLVSAALLIESLARVYRVDPGFQVSHLLTMRLTPSPVRYDTTQKRAAFYQSLIDQISSLPGVSSAAISRTLPLTGWAAAPIHVIGRAEMKLNERPVAIVQNVSSQYFQTMKIPLRRGRNFAAADDAGAERVAIIDETLARQFWPQYPAAPDPIGQQVLIGAHSPPTKIVGIVADTRQAGLTEPSTSGIYLAAAQQPPETAGLAIRVQGEPFALVNSVRRRILALDPDQPVSEVASMDQVVEASEGDLRAMMTLLEVFAGVATIIAVIGLYGVISYSVAQRTKEIGIRRALGAQRGNIFALIVGNGLRLALAGVLLGLGGALIFARLLQGLLFHISSADPLTYIGIAFLFAVIALAASYVPARRAAGIDPLTTLRA